MTAVTLNPRHGTHDPIRGTAARSVGAVRRTSSIDMVRPDGITEDLLLIGRGRDIVTTADGSAMLLAEASMDMRVAFLDGRKITSISATPSPLGLSELLGCSAASGFRARVAEVLPQEQQARSLTHLLLDDVPGAALVSGYAVGAAGVKGTMKSSNYTPVADLCSGWRTGGTIMLEIGRSGNAPLVTGPVAPPLESVDDPDGWHRMQPLPPTGMRRRRCLDVVGGEGSVLTVLSIFRDSHCSATGDETVIHEYEVRAQVDSSTWTILDIVATPKVLPWQECPSAVDSAQRLIGRTLHDLRTEVRAEFTGISTCTHLNDQLRSLTDVIALGPHVNGASN